MLEGNMKAGGSYVCDFKDSKYVIEDKAKKSGDEKSPVYFFQGDHIDKFTYSPPECSKHIETVFA